MSNPYEQTEVVVNPYELEDVVPEEPYGSSYHEFVNREAAFVLSSNNREGSIQDLYTDLEAKGSLTTAMEAVANKYIAEHTSVIDQQAERSVATGSLDQIPVIQEQYKELINKRENVQDTFHEAVAQEMVVNSPLEIQSPEDFDPQTAIDLVLDKIKVQQLKDHVAAKLVSEASWKDYFGLLLNDQALRAAKLTESSIFTDVKEEFRKYHRKWTTLTPAEQEAYLPQIVEDLERVNANPIKIAEFLKMLDQPEEEINFWLDRFFLALDANDAGRLALGVFGGVVGVARGAIFLNKLSKFRMLQETANYTVANLQDATSITAGKLGLSREESAASALPFNQSNVYQELPENIAKDVKGYSETLALLQQDLQRGALQTGGLNLSAESVAEVMFRERERLLKEPGVVSVDPVVGGITDEGILFKVGFTNQVGQESAKAQGKTTGDATRTEYIIYNFQRSDQSGDFSTKELGPFRSNINSPNYVFGKDDKDLLVRPATRGMLERERASFAFAKLIKEAKTEMRKSGQTKKINQALRETEELHKVDMLDIRDLRGTYELNDLAISSYYKTRQLAIHGFHMKNNEVRNKLNGEGFKHIASLAGFIGRPYQELKGAQQAVKDLGARRIYVPDKGQAIDGSSENIAKFYDDNYVLVKSRSGYDDPISDADSNLYDMVLVPKEQVEELPRVVLNYIPGYVPRINKDAYYFIDQVTNGVINGRFKENIKRKVVGAYSTRTAALQARQKLVDAGDLPENVKYGEVRFDREYDAVDIEHELNFWGGGLYTGHRGRERLLVDDEVADLEDPLVSLSRYYQTLARNGILESWRLGVEQRWLNTATRIKTEDGKSIIPPEYKNDFWHAIDHLRPGARESEKRALLDSHRYIRHQTGMYSRDELQHRRVIREFYESMERPLSKIPGGQKLSKLALNLSQKDVTGFMRAAAFHPLLGMYSPAQLLVQASGSLLPMSMHPNSFRKAFPTMLRTAFRDMGKKGAWKATAGNEMDNFYSLWRQSGLMESVNAHADIAMLARGTGRTLDRIFEELDNATIFFRMGEYWNRLASFATAYEIFKKTTKVTPDAKSAAHLKQITDKSFDMMMNLSTANKAKWQEGWLGVLFQFQQIQLKTLEQIFNPHLTKQEKAGMFGVQAAMFGIQGIPLTGFFSNQFQRMFEIEDVDEWQAKAFNRGILGFANKLYGTDKPIDFNSRLSVTNVQLDSLFRMWTGGYDFLESVEKGSLGPAPSVTSKVVSTLPVLKQAMIGAKKADFSMFAQQLSEIPTSTRNALAMFHYFNYGRLYDTKFSKVQAYRAKDKQTWVEGAFIGMGFKPSDIPDAYAAKEYLRGRDEELSNITNEIIKFMQLGYVEPVFDPEALAKQSSYIASRIKNLSHAEKHELFLKLRKSWDIMPKSMTEAVSDKVLREAGTMSGGGLNSFIQETIK